MITGLKSAVERLARRSGERDAASSSHWDHYHRGFRYENGVLEGLEGFGGDTGPDTPWSRLAHWTLQAPYRRMARGFPAFPECSRLVAQAAASQGRKLDLDVLRQALTLSLLIDRLPPGAFTRPFVVIGDGFGTLSSLILLRHPAAKVVAVNLTKTLLVDLMYIARAVPDAGVALAETAGDLKEALASPSLRLVAVPAEDCELLRGIEIGAAANVASMQEMDPPVVARYFELLRSSPTRPYFYCCNREEKTLPDGTVVRFADYPWLAGDEILLDELCPWHQRWYRPVPPFYFPYDGPIRHRLALLARG